MVRTLLCLAIVASQLAVEQVACCRPPDEVANSPIPPLQEPTPRRITRTFHNTPSASLLPFPTAAPTAHQQLGTVSPQRDFGIANTEQYAAERLEIWESSEMREARAFVVEFSQRAAQTSPAEGQQFLKRLSQLSPDEVRNWLERFQSRRTNTLLQQEAELWARQLMLEQAISRQEALRQAFENIKYLRSLQMANGEQLLTPEQYAQQLRTARMIDREGAISRAMQRGYDPLDATTDPMNPRGYDRQVAGAMTLPGDLPREDPRNFMREAADYGEWANSRDAQPPVPQSGPESGTVVDAPAEPIADAPEFVGPVAE